MKRNAVHSWDLDIHVLRISSELSKVIKEKFFSKFDSIYECANYIQPTLNYSYSTISNFILRCVDKKASRKGNIQLPIPIKFLRKLCEVIFVPLNFMEKNLLIIKPPRSKLLILNPKFPITENPISTSLLFHFYGDGSHENWCQSLEKHPLNRKRFFQKINITLGKINNWRSNKHREIYIPRIMYKIFSKLFNVPESLDKNKPPKIEHLSRNCLISALVSVIMDEGHISKTHYEIRISQKSKKLLINFHKICKSLNYEISNISKNKRSIYCFKIKFFGVLKFYKDLQNLNKNFGEILNLGDKQKSLENIIERIEIKLAEINDRKSRGYHLSIVENDIKILKFMKNNIMLTRKDIEKKLDMPFKEVHKRLGTLKQNKLIKVIGFKNKAYLYKITSEGIHLLKKWRNKAEIDLLLKQKVLKFYSKLKNPHISIKKICNSTPKLHIRKFYQLWKNKKNFEDELLKLISSQ